MSGIRWAAILMPTVPKDHLKIRPSRRPSAAFRLEGQLDTLSDVFFRADEEEKTMISHVFMSYLIQSTYNHVYKYVYMYICIYVHTDMYKLYM